MDYVHLCVAHSINRRSIHHSIPYPTCILFDGEYGKDIQQTSRMDKRRKRPFRQHCSNKKQKNDSEQRSTQRRKWQKYDYRSYHAQLDIIKWHKLEDGRQKIGIKLTKKYGNDDWFDFSPNPLRWIDGVIRRWGSKSAMDIEALTPYITDWSLTLDDRAQQIIKEDKLSVDNKSAGVSLAKRLQAEFSDVKQITLKAFRKHAQKALDKHRSDLIQSLEQHQDHQEQPPHEHVEDTSLPSVRCEELELKEDYDGHPKLHFCTHCGVTTDCVTWGIGCYHQNCRAINHLYCILPSQLPGEFGLQAYCVKHFKETHHLLSEAEIKALSPSNIRLHRSVAGERVVGRKERKQYFFVHADTAQYWSRDGLRSLVGVELDLVDDFLAVYDSTFLCYAPREPKEMWVPMPLTQKPMLKVKHYKMCGVTSPFCVAQQMMDHHNFGFLVDICLEFMDSVKALEYCERYNDPDGCRGFQWDPQRGKLHTLWFYHTHDKIWEELQRSKCKFEDIFNTKRRRKAILDFLLDVYCIAQAVGVPNIDWLKDESIGDKIPFLLTCYRGRGLKAHIDLKFEGPVFIITLLSRKREGYVKKDKEEAADCNGKRISWGQCGSQTRNPHASIRNETGQMYFFWGWFTDWAYHGVPTNPGWESVVLIIRPKRVNALERPNKPC